MHRNCTVIVWDGLGTELKLLWNCFRTALELLWVCSETVQNWNSCETTLKLSALKSLNGNRRQSTRWNKSRANWANLPNFSKEMTEIERGITYNCRLDEVDKFWNDVQEADINYMNRGVASASFTFNEIFLPKKSNKQLKRKRKGPI